jgi:trehalose 6-phosphate phosphatase
MAAIEMKRASFRLPKPESGWALFLDVDGTIIDLAATPDAVTVPPSLVPILSAARKSLDGALAIVSGRTITAIDRIVSPLALPCAGEHGAALRLPDGSFEAAPATCALPPAWRERAEKTVAAWPGVWVENKSCGLALHYRQAPERKGEVLTLAQELAGDGYSGFEVLPAHMVLEIRHRDLNKGAAVHRFMMLPPFCGRLPVFVGDDVTDEDGFAAARAMGGLGLHVASDFDGSTENVRRWLTEFGSIAMER